MNRFTWIQPTHLWEMTKSNAVEQTLSSTDDARMTRLPQAKNNESRQTEYLSTEFNVKYVTLNAK